MLLAKCIITTPKTPNTQSKSAISKAQRSYNWLCKEELKVEEEEKGWSYLVPGGVARDRDILLGASLDVGDWDGEGGGIGRGIRGAGEREDVLEVEGAFDDGGDEAGGDVPFDVAVEEPDAWVEESISFTHTVWMGMAYQ